MIVRTHTFESVVHELRKGLEDGTVVLDRSAGLESFGLMREIDRGTTEPPSIADSASNHGRGPKSEDPTQVAGLAHGLRRARAFAQEFFHETFTMQTGIRSVPVEEITTKKRNVSSAPSLERQTRRRTQDVLTIRINWLFFLVCVGSSLYLAVMSVLGRAASPLLETTFSSSLGFCISALTWFLRHRSVPVEDVITKNRNISSASAPEGQPRRRLQDALVIRINWVFSLVCVGSFLDLVVRSVLGRAPSSLVENAFSCSVGFLINTLTSFARHRRGARRSTGGFSPLRTKAIR